MKKYILTVAVLIIACGTEREVKGPKGDQGETGSRGPRGFSGENAESCTVTAVENGALIECPEGDGVVVLNGIDGVDAEPAAYSFTEVINPCGVESGFEEILFRTASGEIVAHYSQGQKQFLTFLSPGVYVTTDGHNCAFTVTNELDVEW